MNIFNSLGSNYTRSFSFKYLLKSSSPKTRGSLTSQLKAHYGGDAFLTYKGRQALELALRHCQMPSGSKVGINGFTCYVVYEAVVRAGYEPVFIDVASSSLNFSEKELSSHKDLKAIIIQNSLGLAAPTEGVMRYAKKKGLIVIEDLAHSMGLIYSDGSEAGTIGDYTMLSFSQDKPLDVVAGGAVINRFNNRDISVSKLKKAGLKRRLVNRLYPFWTLVIRSTYPMGIGRYILFVLKRTGLMARPMDSTRNLSLMSNKAISMLEERWSVRENEFDHRRKIAEIYKAALPTSVQYQEIKGTKNLYLRFPIKVTNRRSLVAKLKSSGIYIGDTWYDSPIGPKDYLAKTSYMKGQCPNAEELASEIVNLPTHTNINELQAQKVAEEVNQWLKSK